MLNPDFSIFNDNMFVQVRKILDPLRIKANLSPLNLTIGEPQSPPPVWLNEVLEKNPETGKPIQKLLPINSF